jgi:hypothetical protein
MAQREHARGQTFWRSWNWNGGSYCWALPASAMNQTTLSSYSIFLLTGAGGRLVRLLCSSNSLLSWVGSIEAALENPQVNAAPWYAHPTILTCSYSCLAPGGNTFRGNGSTVVTRPGTLTRASQHPKLDKNGPRIFAFLWVSCARMGPKFLLA